MKKDTASSLYAIVEVSGRQCRVEPGSRLVVNRVAAKAGAHYVVDRVLLAGDGKAQHIGQPYCIGAKVVCEVLDHRRGPKVINYKFRRRENYRRTRGHRQSQSTLLVKEIALK